MFAFISNRPFSDRHTFMLGMLFIFLSSVAPDNQAKAAQCEYQCTFTCKQPIQPFTLEEDTSLSSEETDLLCSCIWNEFSPKDKSLSEEFVRDFSASLSNLGDKDIEQFFARMGQAIKGCYRSQFQTKSSEMMFDPRDAKLIFAMTVDSWNSNAEMLAATGQAMLMGDKSEGYSLATRSPVGYMIVNPIFRESQKPSSIMVTIGYEAQTAQSMTIENLENALALAKRELFPDFTISGEVEKVVDGLAIFAFIEEAR